MKKIILSSTLVLSLLTVSTIAVNAAESMDPKDVKTTLELTGKTGKDALKITKASNIDLGKGEMGDVTLYLNTASETAKGDKKPQIEVTDLRGTAAGWHVTAELSDFKTAAGVTLTGVQLFFPEVANWTTGNETNTDETKPTSLKDSKLKPVASGAELDGVTIAPGTAGKKTIIRAEDKHGAGRWNVEYSKTAENANTPIYVKIPAGNQVGSYTADLTYGLVDAPIA